MRKAARVRGASIAPASAAPLRRSSTAWQPGRSRGSREVSRSARLPRFRPRPSASARVREACARHVARRGRARMRARPRLPSGRAGRPRHCPRGCPRPCTCAPAPRSHAAGRSPALFMPLPTAAITLMLVLLPLLLKSSSVIVVKESRRGLACWLVGLSLIASAS